MGVRFLEMGCDGQKSTAREVDLAVGGLGHLASRNEVCGAKGSLTCCRVLRSTPADVILP